MASELLKYQVVGDWLTYIEILKSGSIAFSPRSLNFHRRHKTGVTMSSFNLLQLREIMLVQRMVRETFSPATAHVDMAASYSEHLFQQFDLATSESPSIYRHPELREYLSVHHNASQ
jgi:methylphosphotriester-DNA--protein-cysteine methyltransferase